MVDMSMLVGPGLDRSHRRITLLSRSPTIPDFGLLQFGHSACRSEESKIFGLLEIVAQKIAQIEPTVAILFKILEDQPLPFSWASAHVYAESKCIVDPSSLHLDSPVGIPRIVLDKAEMNTGKPPVADAFRPWNLRTKCICASGASARTPSHPPKLAPF